MKQFIGCDAHRRYSVFVAREESGKTNRPVRVVHDGFALKAYLQGLPAGSEIAVESTSNWSWLIDAMEAAGHVPHLVHSYRARKRMPSPNRTDERDAEALANLLYDGTIGEVETWIPSGPLRDLRSLMRTRLAFVALRTKLKNRVLAAVNRYGLRADELSDLFVGKGRVQLSVYVGSLPPETRQAATLEWQMIDELRKQIEQLEERLQERLGRLGWVRLLKSLPGVGDVLGATIWLEVGDVTRFPSAAHLASYAGLVPTVRSSGGRSRPGGVSRQANHYLKWAFVEAANAIVCHQKKLAGEHVMRLYRRLKQKKCHGLAAVAVARHLAEATWWILKRKQPYRAPQASAAKASSPHG